MGVQHGADTLLLLCFRWEYRYDVLTAALMYRKPGVFQDLSIVYHGSRLRLTGRVFNNATLLISARAYI